MPKECWESDMTLWRLCRIKIRLTCPERPSVSRNFMRLSFDGKARRHSSFVGSICGRAGKRLEMPEKHPFIPFKFEKMTLDEQRQRAASFFERMNRRRSVREFSSEPVPFELIETAIRTAGTSPSGAHHQPWRFVVVSDPEVKRRIREAAEREERDSYERRMPAEWLEALAPLGTDWHKEFLEIVPYLIIVFRIDYGLQQKEGGGTVKSKHYYVSESVGIAVGMLLAALHTAGLATLTHTPSPMKFLREILGRPVNETPFVLMPVGYPAEGATVPDLQRKPLEEILIRV
jgi:nitroreductase